MSTKTPWTCKHCGKICTTKGNLKAHEILHSEEKKFSCEICSKTFKIKDYLKTHLKYFHFKIRNLECDVCGRAFYYSSHLKLHKARHDQVKQFFCKICKKGFYTRHELIAHENSKSTHFVSCRFCKLVLRSRDEYKKHLLTHPIVKKKRYFCEICQRRMTTKCELLEHNKVHDKNYECKVCNKKFLDETSFKKHIHRKECRICEKKFKSEVACRNHMWIIHVKPKQKCNICLKYYKNLKLHMEDVHKKEKSHTCDFCSKSFSRASTLKRHFLIHTKEKPFSCDVCNRSFSQSSGLKIHLSTHTIERPYLCNICNTSFSVRSELSKHIKCKMCDQFKNSDYNCKLCSAKFTNKSSLKKHNFLKHIKQTGKGSKEQTFDKSLIMISDNQTDIKPVLSNSEEIKSNTLINNSKEIINEPRILQKDIILKNVRNMNKIAVSNDKSDMEVASNFANKFVTDTLGEIHSIVRLQKLEHFNSNNTCPNRDTLKNSIDQKQNMPFKNLLKYGFTSSKLNMKINFQKNENLSDQIQKEIPSHLTLLKKKNNLPSKTISNVCILCKKIVKSNISEENSKFDKCVECTRSIFKSGDPLKINSNYTVDEFTSLLLPKQSFYKKSILELYDLIEKRSQKS